MTHDRQQPETMTAKQFAELLNCTIPTLITRAEQGKIPAPLPRDPGKWGRRGGRYLWRRSDVERFLNAEALPGGDPEGLRELVKSAVRDVLREANITRG